MLRLDGASPGIVRDESADGRRPQLEEKFVAVFRRVLDGGERPWATAAGGAEAFWDELLLLKVNGAFLEARMRRLPPDAPFLRAGVLDEVLAACAAQLAAAREDRVGHAAQLLAALLAPLFAALDRAAFAVLERAFGVEPAVAFYERLAAGAVRLLLAGHAAPARLRARARALMNVLVAATCSPNENRLLPFVAAHLPFDRLAARLRPAALEASSPSPSLLDDEDDPLLLLYLALLARRHRADAKSSHAVALEHAPAGPPLRALLRASLAVFRAAATTVPGSARPSAPARALGALAHMPAADEDPGASSHSAPRPPPPPPPLSPSQHVATPWYSWLFGRPKTVTAHSAAAAAARHGAAAIPCVALPWWSFAAAADVLYEVVHGNRQALGAVGAAAAADMLADLLLFVSWLTHELPEGLSSSTLRVSIRTLRVFLDRDDVETLAHAPPASGAAGHALFHRNAATGVVTLRRSEARSLAVSAIDVLHDLLRRPRRAELDIYVHALAALQRVILFARQREVRVAYAWRGLFATLTSFARFLTQEDCGASPRFGSVTSEFVRLLNILVTYGDAVLANSADYDYLFYEIVRSDVVYHAFIEFVERHVADRTIVYAMMNLQVIQHHFRAQFGAAEAGFRSDAASSGRGGRSGISGGGDGGGGGGGGGVVATAAAAPRSEADALRIIQAGFPTLRLTLIDRLDRWAPYAEGAEDARDFTALLREGVRDLRRHMEMDLAGNTQAAAAALAAASPAPVAPMEAAVSDADVAAASATAIAALTESSEPREFADDGA